MSGGRRGEVRTLGLRMRSSTLAIALSASVACCADPSITKGGDGDRPYEMLRTLVTRTYPHSPDAFTEGLLFSDGWLYESSGLVGQSQLHKIELETGLVLQAADVPEQIFAEGIAIVGQNLIQLSWRNGRALVWDRETFTIQHEFRYDGEGWGLCFDGQSLVMSDGTDHLQLREPATFQLIKRVAVRERGAPLAGLNELECVGTDVLANVWGRRHIVRIRTATGEVVQRIDTGGILQHVDQGSDLSNIDVLNGIAAIPGSERLLLTGKRWPNVFEVEVVAVGL